MTIVEEARNTEQSTVSVTPVAGLIGARIDGADLTRPLPDADVAAIRSALLQWKVVFFQYQHINPDQQVAFGRRFGDVTPAHPPLGSILRALELLYGSIAEPRNTVRFHWEPGSIAFWDNRATAHLASFDYVPGEPRVLHRITIAGDVPVGPDGFSSQTLEGGRFD